MTQIKINRATEQELGMAIADLEKRGYQLISRGHTFKTSTAYTYKQSSYRPKKYNGLETGMQYWAVMRKVGDFKQ